MPVAELAQRKGSNASEVESVKGDPEVVHASPPSTSSAPEPATENVGIAIQTAVDVVDIRGLHEVNLEASEDLLGRAAAQESAPAEPIEADEIAEGMVSSDNFNTLDRYRKAIERMEKALELRRESWETFELSGFHSLPLGDEQDIAELQRHIDKVLDSRFSASKNHSKWGKSKHILEQCFRALAPFTKNVLSVGMHAAQVRSTAETLE
jgi:hypothetical protein